MADKTGIEWTDATWGPVVGCTAVSEGCDNCYAAREASGRLSGTPTYQGLASGGVFNGTVRLLPERLDQPRRWRKPRRIFVNSMSDLFHPEVPDDFIARVWATMAACPQHTFQILTKRPGRMASWLGRCADWEGFITHNGAPVEGAYAGDGILVGRAARWPLPNVWVGTSVEDQHWANVRVPPLLRTPAAVRFLSCEPLLGPVDLTRLAARNGALIDCLAGDVKTPGGEVYAAAPGCVDWVIAGGESGPYKIIEEDGTLLCPRPMHPQWARDLRDQTVAAGRAFLFKQWGEWTPDRPKGFGSLYRAEAERRIYSFQPDGTRYRADRPEMWTWPNMTTMYRAGKKNAGRVLDGRTWDQYPIPHPTLAAEEAAVP